MSEIKLNLIDSQRILHGMVHASVADRAVAALTADPETISELQLALTRFEKPANEVGHFCCFIESSITDEEPWDAGLMIIDLPARMVAVESTYSHPAQEGQVIFHDSEQLCELNIPYRISNEWQFVYSIEEYSYLREERLLARKAIAALDARAVLYGRPLTDFIAQESLALASSHITDSPSAVDLGAPSCRDAVQSEAVTVTSVDRETESEFESGEFEGAGFEDSRRRLPIDNWASEIHAKWLSTPREDLRHQSPREIILAKQDLVDFDLHSRELQWSFQNEGPPCLPLDSDAYRFAGFGTHEWVIYYDLVRHLIVSALGFYYPDYATPDHPCQTDAATEDLSADKSGKRTSPQIFAEPLAINDLAIQLQQRLTSWLETPNVEYCARTPANLIESERKRLPLALSARDMIVDDDCPICRAMAEDPEFSMSVGFSHFDGSHMDDGFLFSSFLTEEEWEADRRRWKEFNENFAREHAEIEAEIVGVSPAMSAAGGNK